MSMFPGRAIIGVERVPIRGDRGGIEYSVDVLRTNTFRTEHPADCFAILGSRFPPVSLNGRPGITKPRFVRIAVLRDDCCDAFWVGHREPEARRRPIVEHVECVTGNVKRFREGRDRPRQRVKRVHIVPRWRYLGEAEARQVGRNHPVPIREARNQLAEHERGCRKPVQQQHDRPIRRASLSVEDADPIHFERAGWT
jgi:hypothetical protein